MKITRVETMVLNLPMLIDGATPMLGGRARTSIDMLLVRVDTDGGVTGWGEAFGHRIFPATRATIDTLLGPMCVGRDPSQIAQLNDEIQRLLHGIGRSGPAIYALSGIDIALWDIAGKVAGAPLYRLLGGSSRVDLPAYASEVFSRLKTAHPDAHVELDYETPLQLLIATILSAQCTDRRVNMVTPLVFRTYPTAQSLVAFVVVSARDEGSDFELAHTLRKQLGERLPAYMLPRKFVFLDAFPMTANGKADRTRLAKSL